MKVVLFLASAMVAWCVLQVVGYLADIGIRVDEPAPKRKQETKA